MAKQYVKLEDSVNLNKAYTEYLAEQLNNTISYVEYLSEHLNTAINRLEKLERKEQSKIQTATEFFNDNNFND